MHVFEKEFDFVINRAKSLERPARMVVAGADCENILKAVFEAQAQGFGRPILVGNEDRIGVRPIRFSMAPMRSSFPSHSGGQ